MHRLAERGRYAGFLDFHHFTFKKTPGDPGISERSAACSPCRSQGNYSGGWDFDCCLKKRLEQDLVLVTSRQNLAPSLRSNISGNVKHGRCPLWVKSGHVQWTRRCPLSANSGHDSASWIAQSRRNSARRTCRAQERSDLSQLVVCRPPQLVARPRPLYEHWRGPRSVGARYSLQKEKCSVLNSHRCLFSLIAGSIWGTSPNRAETRGTPWRK